MKLNSFIISWEISKLNKKFELRFKLKMDKVNELIIIKKICVASVLKIKPSCYKNIFSFYFELRLLKCN